MRRREELYHRNTMKTQDYKIEVNQFIDSVEVDYMY